MEKKKTMSFWKKLNRLNLSTDQNGYSYRFVMLSTVCIIVSKFHKLTFSQYRKSIASLMRCTFTS